MEYLTHFLAVLYCTLLNRAQDSTERQRIEDKMRFDPTLAPILQALTETDKEDIIKEERARRAAARQSKVDADLNAMETDEPENVSQQICWKFWGFAWWSIIIGLDSFKTMWFGYQLSLSVIVVLIRTV